jgi:hypothetical protein
MWGGRNAPKGTGVGATIRDFPNKPFNFVPCFRALIGALHMMFTGKENNPTTTLEGIYRYRASLKPPEMPKTPV